MHRFKLLLVVCFLGTVVQAQTFSQRLNPVITASETEVCENDEVELSVSYSEPANTSVIFNGIDEHINFPADPAFDFGATVNFTIEFYVKQGSPIAAPGTIIAKGDAAGPGYAIGISNGFISFAMSDGTNTIAISGFTDVADGAWHHVAVVVDRANNATINVDGFYDNDAAVASVGSIDNTGLLTAGSVLVGGANSAYFQGNLDEVRIWNTDLTIAEINSRRTLHLNPNAVTDLVGYWDMNEISTPQLIDCSATGATGTMVNAVSLAADAPPLTWTFNSQWSTGQSGSNTIFVNPMDTTTYKVQIGYCKYLSIDSLTVYVIPCDDIDESALISSIWAPNSFTPNGDNKNDVFLVQGSFLSYYEIMIFNRFGNIVYHSRNILNSWDGTFEGRVLTDDVFSYVITYRDRKDEEYKKYGTITVLR